MFKTGINIPTIRVLMVPVLTIIIAVALSVFGATNFVPQISQKFAQIKTLQQNNNVLKGKVDVLKTFTADAVSDKSDVTYIVLPDGNPAAIVLSQMKKSLAEEGIIEMSKIELSSSAEKLGDIKKIALTLEFSVQDFPTLLTTISKLENLSPMLTLESVEAGYTRETLNATIVVFTYWSPLPSMLPDIDHSITDLSQDQRNTLDKIVTFNLPEFSLNTPSAPVTDRPNPFN